MHYDQPGHIAEEEGDAMLEIHELISEAIDSQQQESVDPRTALDSASERLTFYQELDTRFQAALADATSRAAEIHSKAEAQATALLKYVHDERAQLEATVESLQQYNHVLLSLEQVLQEAASALRQAEEQLEQQMQIFRQTATRMESPKPMVVEEHPKLEEVAIEEHVVPEAQQAFPRTLEALNETIIEEHPKLEEVVIEEHVVPEAQQAFPRTLEALNETIIEEHPKLEEVAVEEHVVPEAQQSVSRTWVRIIGLRQIARLHNIEKTLKARPTIEDVRVVQYTQGVLVLYIGHRSAPLSDIFKELPGIQVKEVHETEDGWIEVHLDGTDTNSPPRETLTEP